MLVQFLSNHRPLFPNPIKHSTHAFTLAIGRWLPAVGGLSLGLSTFVFGQFLLQGGDLRLGLLVPVPEPAERRCPVTDDGMARDHILPLLSRKSWSIWI